MVRETSTPDNVENIMQKYTGGSLGNLHLCLGAYYLKADPWGLTNGTNLNADYWRYDSFSTNSLIQKTFIDP